ncbi:outer membrane protein assembly factor BamD [Halorussus sp. MSC15.2]|uniref:outer membrane protein assembly factor BamD n=1 Tax=Halorussus sp. MSC15.2 TaxID=2283638 RepID=UPI0013D1F085|nr:outer membrane protein assembly factor BamD [Halorussus sp. MSC15.2]NEU55808.1 outer membrane protein assembly factor BamD [Halorussus sp. MSC15.2]
MGADVTDLVETVTSSDEPAEVESISNHELPPEIRALIDEYDAFEGSRDPFLWKWVHRLTPHFTFSFVPDDRVTEVRTAKTLGTVFITILDDFLEKDRDRETFDEAAKIPHSAYEMDPDREAVQSEQLRLAKRVWDDLRDVLADAPRSEFYLPLFRFDTQQAVDAIRYSYLLGRYPELANYRELTLHESHNVMMFAYADIDLMYSPALPTDDLAQLRRMVWQAQMMARIGNWVATWEREIRETDFSSGPVVHALEEGLLTYDELERLREDPEYREEVVERLRDADVDAAFFERWQGHYEELERLAADLSTIDATSYVEGMETVLRYFIWGKGRV